MKSRKEALLFRRGIHGVYTIRIKPAVVVALLFFTASMHSGLGV
jgi:hypothetical protein